MICHTLVPMSIYMSREVSCLSCLSYLKRLLNSVIDESSIPRDFCHDDFVVGRFFLRFPKAFVVETMCGCKLIVGIKFDCQRRRVNFCWENKDTVRYYCI